MNRMPPNALVLASMFWLGVVPALADCEPPLFSSWTNPENFSSVAIEVADMNLDGIPDLVNTTTVCSGTGTCTTAQIRVQLGVGDGTFSAPVLNALVDQQSRLGGLEIGDFNGDGRPDMVTSYIRSSASWIVTLIGNGSGGVTNQVTTGLNAVASLGGHGEFNGDGRLDLVLGDRVVLGNGTGGFAFHATPLPVAGPFLVKDVNLDTRLDLVRVSPTVNEVLVLLGNGNGTFTAAPAVPVGPGPLFVRCGDLDQDGPQDIVTVNGGDGTVSVALGNGDGTFATATHYPASSAPANLEVADLNGDGWRDVVVVGNQSPIVVLRNQGDGTLLAPCEHQHGAMLPSQLPIAPVIARDLNGDHKADLVFPFFNNAESRAEVHLNVGPAPPLSVPWTAGKGFLTAAPNPGHREIRFGFALEEADHVVLDVFDASGRRVARVFEGRLQAGTHEKSWSGSSAAGPVAAGVYWARLSTSKRVTSGRLVWLDR